MIDLHNHLLAGLDDGPESFAESKMILDKSAKQGIVKLLATPHKKDVLESKSSGIVVNQVHLLNEYATQSDLNIKVFVGMENHLDDNLCQQAMNGIAFTINYGPYILVEPPYTDSFDLDFYSQLNELQANGLFPLIAHPERMKGFKNNPNLIENLKNTGNFIQITSGSVLGKFGSAVEFFSKTLLDLGLVDVISSDTHMFKGKREQDLLDAYRVISKEYGEEFAENIFYKFPETCLLGN
tara:strand:- start:1012 stop:1728 length:717 start_codon:yes stop_codon:yes gene_type:complete